MPKIIICQDRLGTNKGKVERRSGNFCRVLDHGQVWRRIAWCPKRLFCAIYIYKRSFYQDRLGTNIGKVEKKERLRFSQERFSTPPSGMARSAALSSARSRMRSQARKRHFLSHLYIKINILPRQARDEHRENSKKGPFFLRPCHLDDD